jgi:uncharacterized damage-inducible protein DinB
MKKLFSRFGSIAILLAAVAAASVSVLAQSKPAAAPATVKSILLAELKSSHNAQDWYVPASKAVEGLTFEQAAWKPAGKDNHSIAQLVNHLAFWDKQNLAKFKGEAAASFSGNNEETFEPPKDKKSWDALVAEMDGVMTGWEKAVEAADDAKLAKAAPTIAHIATHNAYHTGQILFIRKQQGSWDPAKGVK